MPLLPPILALVALSLAAYGWGRAAHLIIYGNEYGNEKTAHAYAAGLGVVALTFVGGILDLIGVANAAVLAGVGYIGIALGVIFAAMSARKLNAAALFSRDSIPPIAFLAVVAGLAIFLSYNLLPTLVFNHHDDFETYFPRIIRLRETGAVWGNQLDVLGLTGFGADAFFQALVMTWLPLSGVTAFDTIFCFILGLLLLAELGRQNSVSWPLIGVSVLVYIFINPMIVNITPVYAIAVLVLTLASATSLLIASERSSTATRIRNAAPVGAVLATLVTFKLTTLFFAIPFLVVLLSGMLLRIIGGVSVLAIFASGAIAFAPWAATQADKIAVLLQAKSVAMTDDAALTIPLSFMEAFRDRPSIYGSNRLDYAFALAAVAILILAEIHRCARRIGDGRALVWIATGIGCMSAYVGIAGFVNNESSLRYSAPFLLSVAALAMIVSAPGGASGLSKPARLGLTIAILIAQIGSIAIFANSAYARALRIATQHTVLSYPVDQKLMDWESAALSEEGSVRIRNAQAKIPAGSRIFAWVELPFRMDYARNDIFQFNHSFFTAPWRIDTADYETVRKEFTKHKIKYVLVEYGSPIAIPLFSDAQLRNPMWLEERIMYENTRKLIRILQQFSARNTTIFAEQGMALIRLDGN